MRQDSRLHVLVCAKYHPQIFCAAAMPVANNAMTRNIIDRKTILSCMFNLP